jgi:hypothetical protein
MYTNTDITIYNYRTDGYHRQVIKNVFWDAVKQSNINKSGLTASDSVAIYIPLPSLNNYAKPKEYSALSEIGDNFTLQANSKDLIVKGEVPDIINNSSPQLQSASLTALKNTYDNVVTVTVVDDKRIGSPIMQHFLLSCK